jgi:tetratricopeptide (TPR) repeat protein
VNTGFSTQQVSRMLGLSPARLRAYVRAGLLCPQRGQSGELRFSFQDLLLLRTAEGLVTDRLPPRRVRDALLKLRRRLPTERPLTGVSLEADGRHVMVRDGGTTWRADSGQGLLSFGGEPQIRSDVTSDVTSEVTSHESKPRETPISSFRPRPPPPPAGSSGVAAPDETTPGPATAEELYRRGCRLEDEAPAEARAAYLGVLDLDPDHADAHVNLGRLMHEAGDLEQAEQQYRAALSLRPLDATAYFNLGVVLEDRRRPDDALETYQAALRVDPNHADAHFNAARLHDLAGRYEAALRHLRSYRNLTESKRT